MKMLPANPQTHQAPPDFPDAASLAALRAWYEGVSARDAVVRYLGERRASGQSARGILGRIRQQLAEFARRRQRPDLAALFDHSAAERSGRAKAINQAIDVLRRLLPPQPQVSDDIGQWLPARAVAALRGHGIETLADLTVRVPRRRRWWAAVPGLGPASARRIEAFFAEHPQLTERARALIAVVDRGEIVPWEHLRLPHEVDGSSGTFRAPRQTCTLNADNDYAAVQALRARERKWTSAGALKILGSAVSRMSIWLAEKVDRTTIGCPSSAASFAWSERVKPSRVKGSLRRASPSLDPFIGVTESRSDLMRHHAGVPRSENLREHQVDALKTPDAGKAAQVPVSSENARPDLARVQGQDATAS
jgi:Phage integrase protein